MALPFLRGIMAKFRGSSQLAHMSAHDMHEIQYHLRETHREIEEAKLALKEIAELKGKIPEQLHHEALTGVFKYVDSLAMVIERYEKRVRSLADHIKSIEDRMEKDAEKVREHKRAA